MARPDFNAEGTPPKLNCKAADGDCDMKEVNVKRDRPTGNISSTDWQCARPGCKKRKNVKF